MRLSSKIMLCITCLLALTSGAESQSAKVVRTIDSANPAPPVYNWHPHNRLGIEYGSFAGVKAFNRVLIKEESGDVVEVPFFHFTARDLGEIMNRMAKFPEKTQVIDYTPTEKPIVDISAAKLPLGSIEKWPNQGVLGGSFCSMNCPPVVEDILGRRAVHFDCNQWYFDTQYNAMVLDTMPANTLKDSMPFTLSAWVLHPKDPDVDDCEMIMSWHARGGNNGTGLDWKRMTCWGDFGALGLGSDLWVEPHTPPKPMMEWTHVAYVYTGKGITGELRIYENGKLATVGKSDYLPELRDPVEITKTSVKICGHLYKNIPNQSVYVRVYVGEYDAHHYGWDVNIGHWDFTNEIGLTPAGDFEASFKDLKPGTKYYYRMFATLDSTGNRAAGEPTRRWAEGVGTFVTATEDGNPGQILPMDTDRYLFLGVQWGSRWYTSYSGPAGFFRGYISDLKLYDRPLSDDELRKEASATAPYDCMPADESVVAFNKADFSWTSGTSAAKGFRFYIDTDRSKVESGLAASRDVSAAKIEGVTLQPGATSYWRVDALDAAGKVLAKGTVWQVHGAYGEPTKPTPDDKSSMSATGYFRWNQTISSVKEQRFYIGQNSEEVANAIKPTEKFNGEQREYYYPADKLDFGATYYWRIETVLEDGAVVRGPVWSYNTYDYFKPEPDELVSEPYPAGITPSRASKVMEGMGHPTISTPNADEATLRDIAHATMRYLRKSPQLRNMLAAHPCATLMGSPEGVPCVDGFACGSYGGMPGWNMTMHEMGHQVLMNGMGPMYPDFYQRLTNVFNAHADNNAWLGDYAACNIHENIACSGHQFISGPGRERLLKEDAPTYYLLSEYLPGDLAIDLHPAKGIALDKQDNVLQWGNRGGVEDRVPGGDSYAPIPSTVGTFNAVGSPKLKTVQGTSAVVFGGLDALVWDRGLQYGFEGNHTWSVELWARQDAAGKGLMLGWGPEAKGVRLYPNAWNICGNSADWSVNEPGKWNHIAFVFEGGGIKDLAGPMRLFVNGREILTKSYKLDLAGNMPVQIGGSVNDGKVSEGFNGALANVRVYNYAISSYQVEEHYTQERKCYERTFAPNTGKLYVDLDATQLEETGAEEHRPLYPESLCKPWVRSWSNKGVLQGRIHNDISDQWHYSGSTPLYEEVDGVQAIRFMGKDRMVGVIDTKGSAIEKPAGTLEAVVYSRANSPDKVVLEWGDFVLTANYLKPGWQHVAVSPGAGNSIVYINGIKAGEMPGILRINKIEHLHLGAHFDKRRESWYRFFNGAIAQMKIHEQPLTEDQIAVLAKQSCVFTANIPIPADGSKIAADRNPVLSWKSAANAAEQVFIGDDTGKLTSVGSFKPGEFKPKLKGGARYFWRVGNGPVWSFETYAGEMISLSADKLPQGSLAAWKNIGTVGGNFIPADRKNLLGINVEIFNGETALRVEKGKTMTFRPDGKSADALVKGPFTLSIRVASDNWTESAPILNWGKGDSQLRLWFGTASSDRRLVTSGKEPPRGFEDSYPAGNIKMIYPEGCNARMAFVWKTITITYANGTAEMWYNSRKIETKKVDLSVAELGDLTLGWDAEMCNGSILLNNLSIYNQVLNQADIDALAKGKAAGAKPIINLSANNLKAGMRVAALTNSGTIKGSFSTIPEIDRKPIVDQVNGKNAVNFNGSAMMSSDFILPEVLADAGAFTVEIWALQDEPSNGSRLLALSQETSDRSTAFSMGSAADPNAIARTFCGVSWSINPEEKPREWVHLAWVYDGGMASNIRLYRNGKLNGEFAYKTIDTIGGDPITLGGVMSPAAGEKALFKGAISSVRIFDYPRTSEEIANTAEAKYVSSSITLD
ncbi:MAG: hypothetical protein NT018_08455 [Armatimonadetes bacterium]|nr:hypothetical protein [Armatimonadota bacterium]